MNTDRTLRLHKEGALKLLGRIFKRDKGFSPLLMLIDANDAHRPDWPDAYASRNQEAKKGSRSAANRKLGSGS